MLFRCQKAGSGAHILLILFFFFLTLFGKSQSTSVSHSVLLGISSPFFLLYLFDFKITKNEG